jgi:aminoglycoside 3-N-acetyltransferase I
MLIPLCSIRTYQAARSVHDDMRIRRLQIGEEADAIRAIHVLKPQSEREGHDASEDHMRRLLQRDDNYLIVASQPDGSPAGFLIAYRVPRVDRDMNMIYLYEIAVLSEFRRQGIGTKMIDLLKQECRGNDILNIWVGTELSNTAARRLYESTGAKPSSEHIIEFTYRTEQKDGEVSSVSVFPDELSS